MPRLIRNTGMDDDRINAHMGKLYNDKKKSFDASGEDVKEIGKAQIKSASTSKLVESMNSIMEAIDEQMNDISNEPTGLPAPTECSPGTDCSDNPVDRNKRLLDRLNQIFTPVLVMQGFETEMNVKEAMSEASVLTEKNIIKFDDQTRLAQLIATCATLIQQDKNTEAYQLYQKAATIRDQMKLKMQKEEYEAAKALAQQYLVMVSTTNNSSIARDAAKKLLPETQH